MKTKPQTIQQLVDEIQAFIDKKREPDEIIKATATSFNTSTNILTLSLEEDFNFYKGAMVTVNGKTGFVEDKYAKTVKLSFKENYKFRMDETVKIDTSLMNVIIARLEKTIGRINEGILDDYNLKTMEFLLGKGEPGYSLEDINFNSLTLNESQKDAVTRSLGALNFHLVIGPPGTGKTYVIIELLEQLLRKNQKILITAWTNLAVDNILEKFLDFPPEKILRIGSSREISPHAEKFTLQKRRENSPDWEEVLLIEDLIKHQLEALRNLRLDMKNLKRNIRSMKNDKKIHEIALDNLLKTLKEHQKKAEKYKTGSFNGAKVLDEIELKWSESNMISEDCSKLAYELLDLEEIEENLPETEVFQNLESDIKKANSRKLLKKVSSPLKRKSYQDFQDELAANEDKHRLMVESYNHYWDVHEQVEEHYLQLYGEDEGADPYYDSLEKEMELVKLIDRYLPLKRAFFEHELSKNSQKILYESYQLYISSHQDNADIIVEEIDILNQKIKLEKVKVQAIEKEIKSFREMVRMNQNNHRKLLEIIDQDIVNESNFIVATTVSSAHLVLEDVVFDWMIMDEASQVASYMSLIPLLKCKRFVLVGDNQQLQPIEESNLSADLNLSIFNRLLEYFPKNSTFLDTQYRMNQEIADVASQLFYQGNLKTYSGVRKQKLDCQMNDPLINPHLPLTFLDTCQLHYHEDGVASGCENSEEAELVVRLVDLLEENGIPSTEIGVITPYKKHKRNIQNRLTNGVKVDTVYSFQGQEKDVIIMTFCNSKLGKLRTFSKEFIGRPSQVNVAITRARKKLIIVGNSRTLKESKLLGELIGLVGSENTVECGDGILDT
ncbi:MAG: AAA domain-containing protein [Methanobacterium formicicum]